MHFVVSKNNAALRLSDILQCGPHPQRSLRHLTHNVAVISWIEQINKALQSQLQFLRRMIEKLQNFNNTAHKISSSN